MPIICTRAHRSRVDDIEFDFGNHYIHDVLATAAYFRRSFGTNGAEYASPTPSTILFMAVLLRVIWYTCAISERASLAFSSTLKKLNEPSSLQSSAFYFADQMILAASLYVVGKFLSGHVHA